MIWTPNRAAVKPPPGSRVNRQHQLGRGLAQCIPVNEYGSRALRCAVNPLITSYYGGQASNSGPFPGVFPGNTNTPEFVWHNAPQGSQFWTGPYVDFFPGGVNCPVVDIR